MNQNKFPVRETVILALGEAIIGVVITAMFILLEIFNLAKFSYKVPLGALLGGAVTVFNFIFLSISVNKAIDKVMENYNAKQNAKPDIAVEANENATEVTEAADNEEENEADPYDDEAARFAQENAAKITAAVQLSYIVRTASVVVALIVAFVTGQFNVLATVIPILCFRPILTVYELMKRKGGKA